MLKFLFQHHRPQNYEKIYKNMKKPSFGTQGYQIISKSFLLVGNYYTPNFNTKEAEVYMVENNKNIQKGSVDINSVLEEYKKQH